VKKKYPIIKEEPSELFLDTVTNASSLVIMCELCGRVYFCSEGDYEKGELSRLRRNAKRNPEGYIEVNDFTHWGQIGGKQAVTECCCNMLSRYENFINVNEHLILDYLLIKHQDNRKEADKSINKINKIISR
jgi:hypothetical protein